MIYLDQLRTFVRHAEGRRGVPRNFNVPICKGSKESAHG